VAIVLIFMLVQMYDMIADCSTTCSDTLFVIIQFVIVVPVIDYLY